ncbi:MAG: hypothetical protein O3B97_02550 [Actinomycetota bacterium]|nr:hypothetical protein [Actinomycetota bacterium]
MPTAYTQMRLSSGANGATAARAKMMTAFHSTGTKAVGVNRPSACSTPLTMPVSPSSGTMGNMSCANQTTSSCSDASKPGANRGIIHGEMTMATSVMADSPSVMTLARAPTSLWASRFLPSSCNWV